MLTLKDVRANMIHGYGEPNEPRRESVAEVILLMVEADYVAELAKGGKAFKVKKQLRLEQCRFVATPEDLRHAAQQFAALADCVEQEFKQLMSGEGKPADEKNDPQTSCLDESADEVSADA
jgi:hypothetical protein